MRFTFAFVVAVLLAVLSFASSTFGAAMYTVTDLGTLGGNSSRAYGINSAGQVVGWSWSENQGGQYAFLYSNGSMQNLGDLSSFGQRPGSFAYGGINDSGQVVGIGDLHAFLYSNGSMHGLGTLNGGPRSAAQGINSFGQVVGYSWVSDNVSHAFLYQNGSMQDLGTMGGSQSVAYGINNNGKIVGQYFVGNTQHAFLYSNGVSQDLGALSGPNSIAVGINTNGQIVGWTDVDNGAHTHAALWQNGSIVNLGSVGGDYSYGRAINNFGVVVGSTGNRGEDSDTNHAFIYLDGTMQDLNSLVEQSPGQFLTDARSINDSGQIVANGISALGEPRAFLLTPVPTPTTALPFALALAAPGLNRRRR